MRFWSHRIGGPLGRVQSSICAIVFGLFFVAAVTGASPAKATVLTFQFSGPLGQGEWQLPKRPAEGAPFVEFANYLVDCCFWRPDLGGRFADAAGQFGLVTVGYQPVFYLAEQLGGFQTLISYFSPQGFVQWEISLIGPQLFSGPLTDPIFEEGEYTLTNEDQSLTYRLRIFDPNATPVGEPSALALLGAGLGGLALLRHRRTADAGG